MNIHIKKSNLYYILLVIVAISIPLNFYPLIYGTDVFQVIWMTNAFRDGALFSENTWLISPLSYFGYYPFSHRAIGVPMFLAFLINLLNFLSFGIFGLTEAILAFDILLIIIIYKSSRNLGNRLFKEEWSRFVFVAAILLSPMVINETTMYVPTRIIITIVMIVLLNLNLKVLGNDKNNKFKITIFLFLLLLVAALAHRLWTGIVITIIFMIFTLLILKYEKLQKLTVFLILPICIIAFFIGLAFFNIDPIKIWSPFFDNSTLIGASTNLILHYMLQVGLILIFFPVGVIITLYKLAIFLKIPKEKREQLKNNKLQFMRKNFYLLLFIIPFSFMAPSFYSVVIFLPILIIFSIYGLIYIKKFILKFSKKFKWIFPMIILFFSAGYSFLYVQIISRINLWYMFVLFSIALFTYLVSFIIHKYNGKIKSKFSFININNYKFLQGLEVLILVFSILIFSTTTVRGKWGLEDSSPYPWENLYLSEEEQEIINFFQNEDIFGLIYTNVPEIANRISGVGFLPVFNDWTPTGIPLYYGFITPNEVHEHTEFSFTGLSKFTFLIFNEYDPIRLIRNKIVRLNVSLENDLNLLQSEYNIQYIISTNNTIISTDASWTLIPSLSTVFTPAFSTPHLLIWRLY
ncbi:hypothetical protein LCGC14_0555370 [marine sediment metagenome]|uniref:Glycosyltransferase RgtA/B/C/D-like domain-containing protein n=1 Tax=marine sediment metagenome TaxID=412755 RepID=A0A0F9RTM4_9ZZZZ